MNYCEKNFKTKADIIKAFSQGEKIKCQRFGPIFREIPDGLCVLNGPNRPDEITWQLVGTVKDNYLVGIFGIPEPNQRD